MNTLLIDIIKILLLAIVLLISVYNYAYLLWVKNAKKQMDISIPSTVEKLLEGNVYTSFILLVSLVGIILLWRVL